MPVFKLQVLAWTAYLAAFVQSASSSSSHSQAKWTLDAQTTTIITPPAATSTASIDPSRAFNPDITGNITEPFVMPPVLPLRASVRCRYAHHKNHVQYSVFMAPTSPPPAGDNSTNFSSSSTTSSASPSPSLFSKGHGPSPPGYNATLFPDWCEDLRLGVLRYCVKKKGQHYTADRIKWLRCDRDTVDDRSWVRGFQAGFRLEAGWDQRKSAEYNKFNRRSIVMAMEESMPETTLDWLDWVGCYQAETNALEY